MDSTGNHVANVRKDRLKGAKLMSRKELEHHDKAQSYYLEIAIIFIIIQVLFG
jgi:hypothetical protein